MKKAKILKMIKICTIICAAITVVASFGDFILVHILNLMHNSEVISGTAGSSIGIIGGADGPTAIYITSGSASPPYAIIFGILTILGIGLQLFIKKMLF